MRSSSITFNRNWFGGFDMKHGDRHVFHAVHFICYCTHFIQIYLTLIISTYMFYLVSVVMLTLDTGKCNNNLFSQLWMLSSWTLYSGHRTREVAHCWWSTLKSCWVCFIRAGVGAVTFKLPRKVSESRRHAEIRNTSFVILILLPLAADKVYKSD